VGEKLEQKAANGTKREKEFSFTSLAYVESDSRFAADDSALEVALRLAIVAPVIELAAKPSSGVRSQTRSYSNRAGQHWL